MRKSAKQCWVLLAIVAAASANAQSDPASCQAQLASSEAIIDRDVGLSKFERLSDQCLKDHFMECSTQSSKGMLDSGTAASCSVGYEVLLNRGFAGNFQSLLAWWRSQRETSAKQ